MKYLTTCLFNLVFLFVYSPAAIAQEEEESSVEELVTEDNAPSTPEQKLESYSKYDFISGENVFFYEDFSQDTIGEFPSLWFTNASGEVIKTNRIPGKWFQLAADGSFYPEKEMKLPPNYTIEFDIIPITDEESITGNFQLAIYSSREDELYDMGGVPGNAGIELNMGGYFYYRSYDEKKDMNGDSWKYTLKANQVNHISIWVQNSRIRLYAFGAKIFDVPQGMTKGFAYNQIRFNTSEIGETQILISNIRLAEAGADKRSKFMTEGKLISYGILFDINSDKLKPESYAAIKEMADILKDNPGVRVKIVGHTDSDGDDASNLSLSKRRAESVKSEMINTFKIDGNIIEVEGKGESQPIAPNSSPLGKSKNRRVEFLKI